MKIDKLIIHCSATRYDRDFTVSDIDSWHKQQGWSGIGYHFVIYRDGTIHNGRDENTPGAHCKGHNQNSLGICLIGGVDANNRPVNKYTDDQYASLLSFIDVLLKKYELYFNNVFCHNFLCHFQKACPCLNQTQLRKAIQLWQAGQFQASISTLKNSPVL